MSSDSAGPPGAGGTRALARLAVLISSKWATWLQGFGSAPLHHPSRRPPSHPERYVCLRGGRHEARRRTWSNLPKVAGEK